MKILYKPGLNVLRFTPHRKINGVARVGDSLIVHRSFTSFKVLVIWIKHLMLAMWIESKIWIYTNITELNFIYKGFCGWFGKGIKTI